MSSALSKYIYEEFKGKGEMVFGDGTTFEGNFQIYLFNAGSLVGSILLTKFSTDINVTYSSASSLFSNRDIQVNDKMIE